jgi:hypothetical protein
MDCGTCLDLLQACCKLATLLQGCCKLGFSFSSISLSLFIFLSQRARVRGPVLLKGESEGLPNRTGWAGRPPWPSRRTNGRASEGCIIAPVGPAERLGHHGVLRGGRLKGCLIAPVGPAERLRDHGVRVRLHPPPAALRGPHARHGGQDGPPGERECIQVRERGSGVSLQP